MKRLVSIGIPTLILGALALELSGLLLLPGAVAGARAPLLLYGGLHLVASVMVALVLYRVFPRDYRRPRRAIAVTLFALAFFVPFFGIPGLLAGLLLGLYLPRRETPEPYMAIDIPDLPYKPLSVNPQPLYGSGGLIGVLRNAPSPERRIRAVMATRQLREQDAIPILRIALRDRVDDVRLLAYSLLDRMEQKINEQIKSLLDELEGATGMAAARLHEQLAHQFWELAYLGLASGDVYVHVLQQALQHFGQALALLPRDAALWFQKGRVLLRLGRPDEAEEAFRQALRFGMSETDVNPYLAETAYLERDWRRVRTLMEQLPLAVRAEPPLSMLAQYWGGST